MADSDDLASQMTALTQRVDEVLREVQDQRRQLTRLTRAAALDAEQLDRLRHVADVWDPRAIEAHVRDAVAAAPVLKPGGEPVSTWIPGISSSARCSTSRAPENPRRTAPRETCAG